MLTMYRSNLRTPIVIKDRGCRTQAQFEAVKSLLPGVDFVCSNPFEGEYVDSEYTCSFAFTYYGTDGKLHVINITPTGRINRNITA